MKEFIKKYFLTVLVLLFFFVAAEIAKSPQPDGVGIYFFDVGQGDAELIQKGDFQILIDGGPDDKILAEIGKIMPLTDRQIDIVILTHPHADHLRGINLILDRYSVGTVYGSAVLDTTNGYLEFLNKVKDKNVSFKAPELYDKIIPFADSEIDFLWPGDKYKSQNLSNLNNSSEVTKFCYFEKCVLFTGDLETDEQSAMFEYYTQKNLLQIFQADILKVAHHGSRNGTNEQLLKNVKPKYAVIEVGADNNYGHPHASTLELLKKFNVVTFRTDQKGTVKFILTKDSISQF